MWKRRVKMLAWNSTFKKLRSWHHVPSLHGKQMGKKVKAVTGFIFFGSKITPDGDCSHEIQTLAPWKESCDKYVQCIKSKNITLPTEICAVKAIVFLVVMYRYESWTKKKAECWRIDAFKLVLEKTLEGPLDSKEIKSVNPKGNQPWVFTGRNDAETPILWLPDAKSQLIWKDPDAGKYWRQEEKKMTEDEMVGWHHRLSGQEFEPTLGDGEGQGSLACCCPWGHKDLDMA